MPFEGELTHTPRGELTPEVMKLSDLGYVVAFKGYPQQQGVGSITLGRKYFQVNYTSFVRYAIEVRYIDRDKSISGPVHPFELLSSFASHALAGGEFQFIADTSKAIDSILGFSRVQGNDLMSFTGTMVAGDWVYIEHLSDETKWEFRRVKTGGTSTVTLAKGVSYGFPAGSIFRHREVYPKCVVVPGSWLLAERSSGGGKNIWDLAFSLETVR